MIYFGFARELTHIVFSWVTYNAIHHTEQEVAALSFHK
jgi:hypothetical protein